MLYAIVAVGITNPQVHAFPTEGDAQSIPVCKRTMRKNAAFHQFIQLPNFPDYFLNRCEQCVKLVNGE